MNPNDQHENRLRQDALSIFHSALAAVDPEEAVHRYLRVENDLLLVDERRYDLTSYDRILVVGAGKAVAPWPRPWKTSSGAGLPQACSW